MNKNVHFVQTSEYYNDEFRIYDIGFLSNNKVISTDLIGQLIYYEISDNFSSISKKETKEIYRTDPDNWVSLYSLDPFLNNSIPEIIIGSSKGEIVHLKNNEISHYFSNNKSSEFSKVKFINEHLISGGDTKGNLTLFDIRQQKPIKIFSEQKEEITDIIYDVNKPDFLLSSSIDSTLCVYDLSKNSLYALSDNLDEELNCLLPIKGCNHILCGTGEGNILIFNWNWFGDFKDQIKGHPEGINSMDRYNDNLIFTGCEDGGVRICSMYPKGLRGILSSKNNKKKSNFKDINKIKISNDKNIIITCAGMDCLRLYNISGIDFETIYKPNTDFAFEDEQEKEKSSFDDNEDLDEEKNNEQKKQSNKEEIENEYLDEEEEEEEEDDDEEEEEEEEEDENIQKKVKDDEEEEQRFNNKNDLKINKEKLFINKKRRKKSSSEESESNESQKSKNEIDESDEDSSSSGKKRKTKKVKKLDKNKKTKSIIDKEQRKEFFNSL